MSGSAAKAERRDLRRAVGVEAVSMIDEHEQAIKQFLLPRVNSLLKLAEEHNGWIRLTDLQLKKLQNLHNRNFFGKLRWLMTGR